MTRLLYEKHVPADDLLAPLFAGMAPDHPQREAAVLAEVFGAPAPDSAAPDRAAPDSPAAAMREAHTAKAFSEEQRARWVALAGLAADEAGLPADPEFRAAFTSYLDWSSRVAMAQSAAGTPGAGTPGAGPGSLPRWDWGPAGPPRARAAEATGDEPPVVLPGPGDTVSFAAHIKPLFREHDRQSMTFAFDLWSYTDVQTHGAGILERLRDGTMPCDGAWSQEKIDVFRRWTESGCTP